MVSSNPSLKHLFNTLTAKTSSSRPVASQLFSENSTDSTAKSEGAETVISQNNGYHKIVPDNPVDSDNFFVFIDDKKADVITVNGAVVAGPSQDLSNGNTVSTDSGDPHDSYDLNANPPQLSPEIDLMTLVSPTNEVTSRNSPSNGITPTSPPIDESSKTSPLADGGVLPILRNAHSILVQAETHL